MRQLRNFVLVASMTLLAAWPAAPQIGQNIPSLRGVWNPVVGAGAAYQIDAARLKTEMEIQVVGKEDVNGKTGYWIEMGMNPNGAGQMYIKNLMVIDGKNTTFSRMIMQMNGQPPMEMPTQMINQTTAGAAQSTDIRDQSEKIGTEDVTTPAGTFSCDHYRSKDGWDVWLSTKITPWGLVKSSGNGQTIVLSRLVSNATDHITGTPQKFDPASFMRGAQPPQR